MFGGVSQSTVRLGQMELPKRWLWKRVSTHVYKNTPSGPNLAVALQLNSIVVYFHFLHTSVWTHSSVQDIHTLRSPGASELSWKQDELVVHFIRFSALSFTLQQKAVSEFRIYTRGRLELRTPLAFVCMRINRKGKECFECVQCVKCSEHMLSMRRVDLHPRGSRLAPSRASCGFCEPSVCVSEISCLLVWGADIELTPSPTE